MSETDEKRGGVSIRCSEEAKATLKKYAQGKSGRTASERISMKMILDLVIPQVVEHDLYDPTWIDKIKAAKRRVEILARMSDECEGLSYGEDDKDKGLFRCIWFQLDGPPKIKNLGKTESLQRAACAACGRTEKIVMELVSRDEKIVKLEADLKAKASEVFKVPICNAGATLGHDKEDQLIFRGCRKSPRVPVSVEKYCKILKEGLPCFMYAETVVAVGKKT